MELSASGVLSRLATVFAAHNEALTADHIALCEIPAPAFGEGPRGLAIADRFRAMGLLDVAVTAVGNVLGRYPMSRGGGPRLAISAHLDTVFGPEVDLTVRREDHVLRAPGIGDDGSGLVMLLGVPRALAELGIELPGELWLAATVGEENVGNLRGARELAAEGVAGQPLDAFITLDTSTPGQIIRHGTWSSNHDLLLTGPGGHAWGEFGVVNPNVTLARIVAKVAEYDLPTSPRTIYNCGILEGGFAPNAIPERARGHLNLRSEDGSELRRLDTHVRRTIQDVVSSANAVRRHGAELTIEDRVSRREGGETPADSRLVQAAAAAARSQGWPVGEPHSSTDANAFMSRGIDAVCLYRGDGGGEHTLDEWYDTATRPAALHALAETVLRYFGVVAA